MAAEIDLLAVFSYMDAEVDLLAVFGYMDAEVDPYCPQAESSQTLEFSQLVRSVVSYQGQDIFDTFLVLHLASCHLCPLVFHCPPLHNNFPEPFIIQWLNRPICDFPTLISGSYCSSVFSDRLSLKR